MSDRVGQAFLPVFGFRVVSEGLKNRLSYEPSWALDYLNLFQ